MRYLEDHGMVHCNVTPRSILLSSNDLNSEIVIKLCDFGMAKKLDSNDRAGFYSGEKPSIRWTVSVSVFIHFIMVLKMTWTLSEGTGSNQRTQIFESFRFVELWDISVDDGEERDNVLYFGTSIDLFFRK